MDVRSLIFKARQNDPAAKLEAHKYLEASTNNLVKKYEKMGEKTQIGKTTIRSFYYLIADDFIMDKNIDDVDQIDKYFTKYVQYQFIDFMRENAANRQYFSQYGLNKVYLEDEIGDGITYSDILADEYSDVPSEAEKIYIYRRYFSTGSKVLSELEKSIVISRANGRSFVEISNIIGLNYSTTVKYYNAAVNKMQRDYNCA